MEYAEIESDEKSPAVEGCTSCGDGKPEPIFAIGQITLRFPSLAIQREYEFERASLSTGTTEHANLVAVLDKRPDLARNICWVLTCQNLERYYLRPRTERELQTLLDAVRPGDDDQLIDTHVIVGWSLGRQLCGGIELPILVVETSYHFARKDFFGSMFDAIDTGKKNREAFIGRAQEAFNAVTSIGGNDGAGLYRAANWAAVRFAPFYDLIARSIDRDEMLASIEARRSVDSVGDRTIAELLLVFEPRKYGMASRYKLAIELSDIYPHPVDQSFSRAYER